MDYSKEIQAAADFIENHITEKLDYADIAGQAHLSRYHFQRVFSILCGVTVGEYIRNRRLSLAAAELSQGKEKVVDTALRYGYESPDSFAKAFFMFHGVNPSQARKNNVRLRAFPKISVKTNPKGEMIMNYCVKNLPEITITGHGKHFCGSPDNRFNQQHDFMTDGNTRFVRYALQGMSKDCETEYCVISGIDDEGYDFLIGTVIPEYFRNHMNKTVGKYENLLTHICIPAHTYVSAETEKSVFSINEHLELRRILVCEWFPDSGYKIADAPEITIIHGNNSDKQKSCVEILIPISKIEMYKKSSENFRI